MVVVVIVYLIKSQQILVANVDNSWILSVYQSCCRRVLLRLQYFKNFITVYSPTVYINIEIKIIHTFIFPS